MTMTDKIVVGFIGLGTMGGKMATNILKAGYKVVVHDLHRQSAAIICRRAPNGRTRRARWPTSPT
jgi:3-hydroxyisobutyrate dehydrogenase-like beta-hydroxyacid dehydrogenase